MGAVWNHYRRAAPDVNIFYFFYERTVLDEWNCPKTRPVLGPVVLGAAQAGLGRGATSWTHGHIGDSIYRKFKKRQKISRAGAARARRAYFLFFLN